MINCFYNLLALSLSLSPIILLLLCLGPVLNKRYSARWRYLLWIVVAIRSLLPVSLGNYVPLSIHVPVPVLSVAGSSAVIDDGGQLSGISTGGLAVPGINLIQIFFVFYLIGVLAYLAYEVLAYLGFRRNVLRWSRRPSDDKIENLLMEQKYMLNIKRDIAVRISKKVSSPMIVGMVRVTLILPAESYPPAELSMIFRHELVHHKRHDICFKLILMLTTAIHWFNPLVHLMAREAIKDMERSCDDYVLKGADLDSKKRYCELILKLALQDKNIAGPVFSSGISSSREDLELRIKGIFESKRKRRGIASLTMIAVLLMMSGLIFNIGSAKPLNAQPPQNQSVERSVDGKNGTGDYNTVDQTGGQGENPSKPGSEAAPVRAEQSIAIGESRQEYYTDKQAESPAGNSAELVVIDLNQLEEALD